VSAQKRGRRVFAEKSYVADKPRSPRCKHGYIICPHDCQEPVVLGRAVLEIAKLTVGKSKVNFNLQEDVNGWVALRLWAAMPKILEADYPDAYAFRTEHFDARRSS
jgi:hypothetical protein